MIQMRDSLLVDPTSCGKLILIGAAPLPAIITQDPLLDSSVLKYSLKAQDLTKDRGKIVSCGPKSWTWDMHLSMMSMESSEKEGAWKGIGQE